jgi:hypothetical protein
VSPTSIDYYIRESLANNLCLDVVVVYAVVATITCLDWVFRGRKSFRGVDDRKAHVSGHGVIVDIPGHGKPE